jgi:hypothetical protein
VSYEAKWKDTNGNTCCRNIPRPEIAAKYFLQSNKIDMFNQARQAELKLEKHWVTEDGYFRCIMTLFGTCVTDAWKGYQFHLSNKHHHKTIEIMHFAKLLTKDLLENKFSCNIDDDDDMLVIEDSTTTMNRQGFSSRSSFGTINTLNNGAISISQVSELTDPPDNLCAVNRQQFEAFTVAQMHTLCLCDELVTHSVGKGKNVRTGKRKRRGKCIICKSNTRHYCQGCERSNKRIRPWCCSNEMKRQCHAKHLEEIKKKLYI